MIVIAKCVMVIVLSVDTGALIVAAIVTMLPFESAAIISTSLLLHSKSFPALHS